ncbi:hypothetical protein SLVCU150_1954 [Staphylococcus lugdunensis VCU150]|nr:hypothetical protein SEVCU139_1263 [Staphylococcus lugdunensis VCU139]KAK56334.1 hypothetical protein SLVCU150_1954 [Staphylococcus lugdunensis VCU150]KAK61732.1 hypothetical protein SLVCU148_1272 [Staphylococcus lugdunensis VCU148]
MKHLSNTSFQEFTQHIISSISGKDIVGNASHLMRLKMSQSQ